MSAPDPSPKYDVLSAAFHAAPDGTLARMREEDPVYWHPTLRCWFTTRYDDVQAVLRDPRFSVEKGGAIENLSGGVPRSKIEQVNDVFSTWMVFADPPQHTKLRGVLAKLLGPQAIVALEPVVQAIADELLDAVQGTGRMEVIRDFALPLPAFVVARILDVPRELTPDMKRWSNDMFALFGSGGLASEELIDRVHRSVFECRSCFAELIARRAREPGSDLISALLKTDLSPEQVLATAQMIMVGSNETTTYLTANGLLALLRHPEELERLREDPSLHEGAVEELIRYTGPALSVARRALTDASVGGVPVRAGEIVCCMLQAANFDPARFADPTRLDVGRKDNRHLGLGFGIHFCIGAALTRLETRTALATLLRRCDHLHLEDTDVAWEPNLAIRGFSSLQVGFRPHTVSELRGLGPGRSGGEASTRSLGS